MVLRRALRACAALAVVGLLAACGSSGGDNTVVGRAGNGKLTIGVRYDQPGLGEKRLDGKFVGFDIDVAKYVAKELGVDESGITWKEAQPSAREDLLGTHKVDFVVASYSITDKRKEKVAFAGPYFVTGQGLLVRLTDNSITGPETLNNKRLCSVSGSTSAQAVRDKYAQGVSLVEYARYSDCVTALLANNVDAVTTDEAILAGFAAENPELLKLVGKPFTQERYGIGVAKDDSGSRDRINSAIDKMISTGDWKKSLERNVGPSGYAIPQPPQITEK
ncbi:glutamate ABC transporter substrate-binding protein [Solihabitans fulvus]|uniref:Glutamate ABC transporter substrate-binding protein n=1 Tax=Solihabitans fulvus TaxID=1892852 RepID=A0A5B2XM11_9PSEU|nr:glutamate ABC transporter substrate-binding protein [Solihabitans fulvus]KAA2264908.1 glutamate ABC transporter substrate-binding protein [Solihabitans fulvus]